MLPSMSQKTPSDRSDVSGNKGAGYTKADFNKFPPATGQKQIWGNLANQPRGMTGKLDTQGEQTVSPKHLGFQHHTDGAFANKPYKNLMNESTSDGAGAKFGKKKINAAASKEATASQTKVANADTNYGGKCNCNECQDGKKPINEGQVIGATLALISADVINGFLK